MDPFYGYGFAFPVWNSFEAGKAIIYGTKHHSRRIFFVNLAWMIGWYDRIAERVKRTKGNRKTSRSTKAESRKSWRKWRNGGSRDKEIHDAEIQSGGPETVDSDGSSDATRNV